MKRFCIGLYVCALLFFSSVAFGQNQYYAVTGGSTVDGAQLTVIDVNAQRIVGRLGVPQPIGGVAISADNSTVYATAAGTPDAPANGLYIVDISDPTTPTMITTIDGLCGTETNANLPAAVALTQDNAYAYVACLGSPLPGRPLGRWVVKVDTTAMERVARIDMRQGVDMNTGPFGVLTHPNGQEMWVTLYGSALVQRDKVVRVNIADDTILGTITTGAGPTGGAFCVGGNYAYISVNKLSGQNEIAKIDLDTLGISRINVPVGTVGIAFTSDCAFAYAGGYGNLAVQNNKLVRINTATSTVDSFPVTTEPNSGPFNVVLTSDDQFLLITMFGTQTAPGNTIKVLNLATGDFLPDVVVGPAPSGIAVTVPQ